MGHFPTGVKMLSGSNTATICLPQLTNLFFRIVQIGVKFGF